MLKTCGWTVNFLWTKLPSQFFFAQRSGKICHEPFVSASSSVASLDRSAPRRKIRSACEHIIIIIINAATIVSESVHRYEESIGGRPYLIEVRAVSSERWRAYIVRLPGVPTALMPFYGRTPDEAVRQLSEWLTRAYARATPSGAA